MEWRRSTKHIVGSLVCFLHAIGTNVGTNTHKHWSSSGTVPRIFTPLGVFTAVPRMFTPFRSLCHYLTFCRCDPERAMAVIRPSRWRPSPGPCLMAAMLFLAGRAFERAIERTFHVSVVPVCWEERFKRACVSSEFSQRLIFGSSLGEVRWISRRVGRYIS